MFVDVRGRNNNPPVGGWKLINVDTGEEIKDVVWADDEKGIYGQHRLNEDGQPILDDTQRACIIDKKLGNIRIEPGNN